MFLNRIYVLLISFALASGAIPLLAEEPGADTPAEEAPAGTTKLPQLAPDAWAPVIETGCLFTSFILTSENLREDDNDREDDDPFRIGDAWGTLGIAVRPAAENSLIKIRISGTDLIKSSVFTATLPQGDATYRIFPPLKYDYEKLEKMGKSRLEEVTFKVTINGKESADMVRRVLIAPAADCLYAYTDCMGVVHNMPWMFAAYVDEKDPAVEAIMKETLKMKKVETLGGYQKDANGVFAEIDAVWTTMWNMGYRFDQPGKGHPGKDDLRYLTLTLPGTMLNLRKGDGTAGALLLAGVLRKAGLEVNLVLFPERLILAVDLDEFGDEVAYIDVGMLGYPLRDAVREGRNRYEENAAHFESDRREDWDYQIINLSEARRQGIKPLKGSVIIR